MVDSTQSITRVYSTTNRQTVLGVDNRRTTVINKVNPYLQQKRRSQLADTFSRRGRCQAWRVELLSLEKKMYSSLGKFSNECRKKPNYCFTHEEYQIFCPACDVYFININDYRNHVIIQNYILPYKTIIAEYNSEQTEKENRVEINNGSKQNKGRKSLVGQKLPFEPYILSNTKQYFDEDAMWEHLKVQRSKALKIRKKAKLAPLRMSNRNMLRRATIKISQDLNTRNTIANTPAKESKRVSKVGLNRRSEGSQLVNLVHTMKGSKTDGPKNIRNSVLDCSTSKRLTLQQTAKLAKLTGVLRK